MFTRFTKLLRAAALVGATVSLTACVADPYGYAPVYGGGYGGYYGGGYRAAPAFFAPAAYRPQPHYGQAFRPMPMAASPFGFGRPAGGGFFGGGGGGGFAPRMAMPAGGGFAPRGPMGGFFGHRHR